MKRLGLILIVVVVVTAGATLISHRSPASAPARTEEERGDGPPKDWSMPFNGAGVEVGSIAQALTQVDFPILVPKGETPAHIIVSHEADAVGWSFDLPQQGGWVDVTESKARMTAEEYQKNFLEAPGQEPGFFSATTVAGGRVPATMAAANGIGRLLWVDAGVQFDVTGEGITPDQVAALVGKMFYSVS